MVVYSVGVGSIQFAPARPSGSNSPPLLEFSNVLHVPALKSNLVAGGCSSTHGLVPFRLFHHFYLLLIVSLLLLSFLSPITDFPFGIIYL